MPRPRMLVPAMEPATAAPVAVFEAVVDPVQLTVLLLVVGLPFCYWWLVTVPEARTALGIDKRVAGGEARAFIEELADTDTGSRRVEKWFFAKWLERAPMRRPDEASGAVEDRDAQAPPEEAEAGPKETPATPTPRVADLFAPVRRRRTPRFFSGDNPVVVTMGSLTGAGILAAAAREVGGAGHISGALAADIAIVALGLAFGLSRFRFK